MKLRVPQNADEELAALKRWHRKAKGVSHYEWDRKVLVIYGLGKPMRFNRRQVEDVIFSHF